MAGDSKTGSFAALTVGAVTAHVVAIKAAAMKPLVGPSQTVSLLHGLVMTSSAADNLRGLE